jgi:hypothetical protein
MIRDRKVIAFTPCGRKRYMDLLAAYVVREHNLGNIDKWVLFNNPYVIDDSTYADQIAAQFDWVEVIKDGDDTPTRTAFQIARFYGSLKDSEAIYVRLDDDLVYFDKDAIVNLVNYRIDNPKPFLVYPMIINNTRMSFQLQKHGLIPESWGIVEPILCAPTPHVSPLFVFNLHEKALTAIEGGTLLEEFTLPSEQFTDWDSGNISVNCFAMLGEDMAACTVNSDEEGYLSRSRPQALRRYNARCGNAIVIHFAYNPQTVFMDKSGMLTDYARLVEPLPFRTQRLPPSASPAVVLTQAQINRANTPMMHLQREALKRAMMRPGGPGGGLKA